MSLAASVSKFKQELAESAARNVSQSRPASTTRTSTPVSGVKRSQDGSVVSPPVSNPAVPSRVPVGGELLTHVIHATNHLKDKFPAAVTFDDILAYLSLPVDLQKRKPIIRIALQDHDRVTYTSKANSPTGKETFQYNPIHPVTSTETLVDYLARRTTFAGVPAKELKDVWADSVSALDKLESQHKVLVTRNKKDNTPRTVWADEPTLHAKQDADFMEYWSKTKLPATEIELRNELEKAGLTPTSQVKEVRKIEQRKKEKRRINRASGRTTNLHMMGILKDYSKK